MTKERYADLDRLVGMLTIEERQQGWHFCYDWDGMLIGPGMKGELEWCLCPNKGVLK